MVVRRYPHTATLSYVELGTYNSIGFLTEGTLFTIGIICNIQPAGGQDSIVDSNGIVIPYNWRISSPLYSKFDDVPVAAKLEFFDKEHIIKQLFSYQYHAEIKC